MFDDPHKNRHPYTAYVCMRHFQRLFMYYPQKKNKHQKTDFSVDLSLLFLTIMIIVWFYWYVSVSLGR